MVLVDARLQRGSTFTPALQAPLLNVKLSKNQRHRLAGDKQRKTINQLRLQVRFLHDIIAELTSAQAKQSPSASTATVFDLFEGETSEVSTQTDISVDHLVPDLFWKVDHAGLMLPLVSVNEADADAAAGAHSAAAGSSLVCRHPEHHPSKGDGGGTSVTTLSSTPGSSNPGFSNCAAVDSCAQDGGDSKEHFSAHSTPGSSSPGSSSRAVGIVSFKSPTRSSSYCEGCDDNSTAHSEHIGTEAVASGASDILTVVTQQGGPAHDLTIPAQSRLLREVWGKDQCGPLPAVAQPVFSGAVGASANQQCGPSPRNASPRAFDASSGDKQPDFDSQNLANTNSGAVDAPANQQCGPSPLNASLRAFDAIAGDKQADFNSQNLANLNVPPLCEPAAQCDEHDVTAIGSSMDFKSQHPAVSSNGPLSAHITEDDSMAAADHSSDASPRALDAISQRDFNSQHLAVSGRLPNHIGDVLFDANNTVQDTTTVVEGFNSQTLASSGLVHAIATEISDDSQYGSSQSLSQCGPLPRQPLSKQESPMLFDANDEKDDFNSHSQEGSGLLQCGPLPLQSADSQNLANTCGEANTQHAPPVLFDAAPSEPSGAVSPMQDSTAYDATQCGPLPALTVQSGAHRQCEPLPTTQANDDSLDHPHAITSQAAAADYVSKLEKCLVFLEAQARVAEAAHESPVLDGIISTCKGQLEEARGRLRDFNTGGS